MTQTFDLRAVSIKVYALLLHNESCRDDDKLLLTKVWEKETHAKDVHSLLEEIRDGTLSHFESVRRVRQRIQEKNPSLRGEKWDTRHKVQADFYKQLTFLDEE